MTPLPQPDLNYLQRVLLEMLAIPSPTGFTDTIVRYVAEQLDELGVPFEMTRRGTIRATLQGRLNTPDRAVSAHLDTIGALVREIKPNGRLGLAPVGCWSSRFAEGSRVTVFTEQGVFRGSVLPLLASGHAFNTEVDNLKISWDNIELRLDAYTASRADSESLGISVGDYVAFDPLPEFTESGHISARHLDDKAGVAALLAALKAVKESGQEPPIDCHPLFTITEEVGSGAAGALPWDVSEFVGIDIAPVAEGQNSNEHSVSVAMQDSGGRPTTSICRGTCCGSASATTSPCAATCSATTTATRSRRSPPATTPAPRCWRSAATPPTATSARTSTASPR